MSICEKERERVSGEDYQQTAVAAAVQHTSVSLAWEQPQQHITALCRSGRLVPPSVPSAAAFHAL